MGETCNNIFHTFSGVKGTYRKIKIFDSGSTLITGISIANYLLYESRNQRGTFLFKHPVYEIISAFANYQSLVKT